MSKFISFVGKLIGKLIGLAILAVLGLVLYIFGYFALYKANQPMQVAEAQAVAPGLTFRELWADRFAGWEAIDERRYAAGESESKSVCVFTEKVTFPISSVLIPVLRVWFTRQYPGTPEAETWLRGSDYVIAPSELSLLDAWWWQIENETWFYWGVGGRPYCYLGYPKRPAGASE